MLNIIYVFLICSWSFVVGRIIAFGVRSRQILTFVPFFSATSWYKLTPFSLRLPNRVVRHLPTILVFSSGLYLFLVDPFFLQAIIIICMVSTHAFTPVFVFHRNSESLLTVWSLINIVLVSILIVCTHSLQLMAPILALVALSPTLLVLIWFCCIQLQLSTCVTINFQGIIDLKRQPRLV